MSERDARAGAELAAHLEPRAGSAPVKALRWTSCLLAELLGNLLPQPSLTDLVVRRIADNAVVLQLPAGDIPASEQLLNYVRNQLDELTIDQFLDRWNAPSSTK